MGWRISAMLALILIGLMRAWSLGAFAQTRAPTLETPTWMEHFIEIRKYADGILQQALPTKDATFLSGILFGGSGIIDPELKRIALATGTLHLFAVSGFNLTILANLWEKLSAGHSSRKIVAYTGILLTLFYLFLTGATPSVQRAAVFAIAARIAPLFNRSVHGFLLLCWYVVVVVWWTPFDVINLSFVLTVGATAGLLIFENPIERFLDRIGSPSWLSGGVATTIAATLGTLPVQLLVFHRWSNVFLFSNLIVVPTVSLLTVLGVAALFVQHWPFVGQLVIASTWVIITFDRAVLTYFAGLPHASIDFSR